MVFRLCGYSLKRDASQQVKQGSEVVSLKEAKPGDLAFFINEKEQVSHVGIILSERKIIHASGRVRIDKMGEDGIHDAETGRLTHTYYAIRRILQA